MIANTTALELVQTLLVILGALGVVGSICFASAITSIKHTEMRRELDLAEKHEAGETQRHRATLDHEARMKEAEIEARREDAVRAIEQGPPLVWEPRIRFPRPLLRRPRADAQDQASP